MAERSRVITKEEALASGYPFYGVAREIYWDGIQDPDDASLIYMLGNIKGVTTEPISLTEGEVLGTFVGTIAVDSDRVVLGDFVQRSHYRWRRSYERNVRKTIKQEAASILSRNRALTPNSLLFQTQPDAGTEI